MFVASIELFPWQQFQSKFCLFFVKTLAKGLQANSKRNFHCDFVVICDFIKKELWNCSFNYIFGENDEGVFRQNGEIKSTNDFSSRSNYIGVKYFLYGMIRYFAWFVIRVSYCIRWSARAIFQQKLPCHTPDMLK